MKVCVIVNPMAGPALLRPDINKALAMLPGFGWTVEVVETSARHHGTELAQQAVAQGYDMVVACGGDGTINEVLQALPGTNVTLGVIPAGTANVFAREMHIPLKPAEAVLALANGQTSNIDVGLAGNRYFLLWAGIGFDAEVLLSIKPKNKRRYGIPAFVVATILTIFRFEGTRAEITIDDLKVRRRVLLAILSNIKSYALFELARDARSDDGLFDVSIFEGSGLSTKIRHLLLLALRRHYRSPETELYRAAAVTLRTDNPLPVQVDGDVIGQTPMSFRIVPHGLKVVLPPVVDALQSKEQSQRMSRGYEDYR